nr:site-2 protease family protein [Spirulina major]
METIEILLLIFLGIISYFIVKRSVANLTTTPIWLLWLVLMAPPLLLTVWMLILGEKEPLPLPLMVIPFVLCPLLYWWLIQKGRPIPAPEETTDSPTTPSLELSKNPRPLTPDEEKSLRKCFPWGVYYLQAVDYLPQAILCRGRLKSNPEQAYQTVRENVEDKFGDRFLLIFQEGVANKPFFALVPNPRSETQKIPTTDTEEVLQRPQLVLGLFLITLFTTTLVGAAFTGITPEQFQANPRLLLQGLPYSLALMLILGVHEFSHYGAAIYYRIRTTLPYFIPMPFFLGTMGAFIQMRSPVPHRRALFDIAFAGPIGGFLVTVPLLIWGLSLSEVVELSDRASLLNFEALDPRFSLFLAVLGKLTLGDRLGVNMAIHLHPLAIAGYLGVIVTALNLMPVGQLDGGHIVHAMFGQRMALIIGQIARLLMLLFAFARQEFIIWAIVLLFMPNTNEPALNDVTELDNRRDFLGLCALTLLVIILLPLPGKLASVLGV